MGDESPQDLRSYQRRRLGLTGSAAPFRFNGPNYDPAKDRDRLSGQILAIFDAISDGSWKTLGEIEEITKYGQASISAQLRHLRKERFGGHTIEKRRRGSEISGLWEYRLLPNRALR